MTNSKTLHPYPKKSGMNPTFMKLMRNDIKTENNIEIYFLEISLVIPLRN